MARKRDDTVKLVLRLPPALHKRLGRAAADNGQSLNSEMLDRLQRSFDYEAIQGLEADVVRAMRYGMLEMLRLVARGDEGALAALKNAQEEAALRKALHDADEIRKADEGEKK
jgi:Arc-like DNA binding domain